MSGRPIFTEHARRQAARRGIAESTVLEVVTAPEQALVVRAGREVRQSRVTLSDGGCRLLRVVVDLVEGDMTIVTVYRTSKLAKYWRAR